MIVNCFYELALESSSIHQVVFFICLSCEKCIAFVEHFILQWITLRISLLTIQ